MNGRLYDPLVGRFLSPDNYVQSPDLTQSFNRYGYCWNNPLKYTDPDGEFVVTACLIAAGVGILIDYGMQVGMNYLEVRNNPGMTNNDIWLGNIDWFDVAISGTISGLTAGYGASIKGGQAVGKFGTFVVKNAKYVKAGEILLTSGVDITGDGWQSVTGKQFGQRVAIAGLTWGATELVSNAFSKAPSIEQKSLGTARDNLLNSGIKDTKLKNMVNDLYRPGANVGSGSTADALLYEKATGILLSKTGHLSKAQIYSQTLQQMLYSGNLCDSDRKIVFRLLSELNNAISK